MIKPGKRKLITNSTHTHPTAKLDLQGPGKSESVEKELDPVEELHPAEGEPAANVSQSVSVKVSEAVHWGPGTWDKIPYSVEVHSFVSLPCVANIEKITCAQDLAMQLAWQGAYKGLESALAEHVLGIQRLYPVYFSDPEHDEANQVQDKRT
jgi:hypothetical protein